MAQPGICVVGAGQFSPGRKRQGCVGVDSKTYRVVMTVETVRETTGSAPILGIADVALLSGLSADTLRWYEREGLVPRVARGSEREAALVIMLARLRDTGMPTEDMREFSRLVTGGAATHGQRLAILERHRARIAARQAQLVAGLAALDDKAEHYRHLIAAGLDCDGAPVSDEIARLQSRTTTNGPTS
jgi:DNA-binding transcriptional MerR regulator